MNDTIKTISEHLSRIFRHMLPGIMVVAATHLARPSLFTKLDLSQGWHVAVLASTTLAVGNIAYVLHRYTIHQLIDFCLFLWRRWVSKTEDQKKYRDFLFKVIVASFNAKTLRPDIWEHLHLRSSQLIFMFIFSEVMFGLTLWAEPNTIFISYACAIQIGSIAIFLATLIQYALGDFLDRSNGLKYGKEMPPKQPVVSA